MQPLAGSKENFHGISKAWIRNLNARPIRWVVAFLALLQQEEQMPLCEKCAGIETYKRGADGHDGLKPTGKKRGYKPFAQAGIVITEYMCSNCGALWEYENDKNDSHVGWSVVVG